MWDFHAVPGKWARFQACGAETEALQRSRAGRSLMTDVSPKLWSTTVTLGWTGHKKLHGGNGHRAGREAGGADQEPGIWHTLCHMGQKAGGLAQTQGQVSISHPSRVDTEACPAAWEAPDWRKGFLPRSLSEGLSLRIRKALMSGEGPKGGGEPAGGTGDPARRCGQ